MLTRDERDSSPLASTVRTEPIQRRSSDRLVSLLDAAAAAVDEFGFERVTTADIATRAGASIGTVYRYFPDRIAILIALRERAYVRYREQVIADIHRTQPAHWWDAVDCAVLSTVKLYREEPGFRIIHFTDDGAPELAGAPFSEGFFAGDLAELLSEEFGLNPDEELRFHLEVAIQLGDALTSRAFKANPQGDPRFLEEARRVVRAYLVDLYGNDIPKSGTGKSGTRKIGTSQSGTGKTE